MRYNITEPKRYFTIITILNINENILIKELEGLIFLKTNGRNVFYKKTNKVGFIK